MTPPDPQSFTMFENIKNVLVANRGEIACRIIKCCKENGLHIISVYSAEDSDSMHVTMADESYLLPGVGANAYINIDAIVNVAVAYHAHVVVPGYGFLSENSNFAEALQEKGIIFAGPSVESVQMFGLKHSARTLAQKNNVPVVPGTDLIQDPQEALKAAHVIGYPVMLKSTAGGGGMGLKVVWNDSELTSSLAEVISRGQTLFKNDGVFLEKYVQEGRHIEVQIFGNGKGDVLAFGERECSIQRRHQKVIEETPSPFILLPKYNHKDLRRQLSTCAIKLASSVKYKSAGTVEFLVDDKTGEFYFLEMNTRLQVEHGITELVYDVDLMKLMLLQAEYEAKGQVGIPLEVLQSQGGYEVDDMHIAVPHGHAIEVRVYAENPIKDFQPSPGILHLVDYVKEVAGCKLRIDHWVATGSKISPYFDPLIAKIMVWGPDRVRATNGMIHALQKTRINGPTINLAYLTEILKSSQFQIGNTLTSFLNTSFHFKPQLIEFVKQGSYTTIQDLPGRELVNAGVPLGGPVDLLFFQLANLVVGNDRTTAALEISMKGPLIRFHTSSVICLAGGEFKFSINGKKVPMFTAIDVPEGAVVKIGDAVGHGARGYLAIKGGFPEVAEYLGSKACTPTLNLGGHQGRPIMAGDCLTIHQQPNITDVKFGVSIPELALPLIQENCTLKCLGGPHDTAEICDPKKIANFYDTIYSVNLNSNRGCTRLDGQSDVFSRTNGRDGGAHPSNILEYPYPTCGVSVVGNVMSLFGVDGGTLSGFVCISTPIRSEWWKGGQAKVGSRIQFKQISFKDSLKLARLRENYLQQVELAVQTGTEFPKFIDELNEYEKPEPTILYHRPKSDEFPEFCIRQGGENMIIIDFGLEHFTLVSNGRMSLLQSKVTLTLAKYLVRTEACTGALGIVFKNIDRDILIKSVIALESNILPTKRLKIKSKLYKLPICFEHHALTHCIERYMHTQRPYAPYLPNNTEFVMKANLLTLIDQFKANVIGQKQVVTAVSFLCANTLSVNIDPRTRFKTGKYNPARTFTPKGAIGSGAVAHSIYSIDSPGGYMIWGMVLPDLAWNTFGRLNVLQGKPWFFENFDQIEYYEVTEAELTDLNNQLLAGKLHIESEDVEFDFEKYISFLESIDDELQELNTRKQEAIEELMEIEEVSRNKWLQELEVLKKSKLSKTNILENPAAVKVTAEMAANIFKISVKKGDTVTSEDVLVILEAMKMEIPIRAIKEDDDSDNEEDTKEDKTSNYEVAEVTVEEGDVVSPGDVMMLLLPKST